MTFRRYTCIPESDDRVLPVIVHAAEVCMLPQVLQINRVIDAPEKDLDFLLIEHPQPLCVNHLQKSFKERLALELNLFTEPVVRYQLDVLQTVLAGNGYVAAIGNEVKGLGDTKVFNSDGEVERKVFRIAGVVFQENESLVKVGIEGRKVIQKALLLAEPLREEEAGERDIHKDALVHRLAEDPTNETIPVKAMLLGGIRVRIRI